MEKEAFTINAEHDGKYWEVVTLTAEGCLVRDIATGNKRVVDFDRLESTNRTVVEVRKELEEGRKLAELRAGWEKIRLELKRQAEEFHFGL